MVNSQAVCYHPAKQTTMTGALNNHSELHRDALRRLAAVNRIVFEQNGR